MECFKIRFGSGTALNHVDYGRYKKKIYCEGYVIGDAGKKEEEQVQEDQWTL